MQTQAAANAVATVSQTGGAGGVGVNGASGGAGGSSTLTNAVSGATNGGVLTLLQGASGGAGGSSSGWLAGNGGAASSSLTWNDTAHPTQSSKIVGSVGAFGGAGGSSTGPLGGTGGAATATLAVIGSGTSTVSATTTATGGSGGASLVTGGSGGAATASSNVIGLTVNAAATATGGAGPGGAGTAMATAAGNGQHGAVDAHASTSLPSGARVFGAVADASGSVVGSTVAVSEAVIGASAPAFITNKQAEAFAVGAPLAADTTPVVTGNPIIAGAIGNNPSILGLGLLGGSYSPGGTGVETMTSSAEFKIALNSTDLVKDLIVGLYGGANQGAGVTGGSLDIKVNGHDTLTTFNDGQSVASYFGDKPVDLGQLSGATFASGTVDLLITLKVTADSAGAGFTGGFIVTG
jgi:hypothetical protein